MAALAALQEHDAGVLLVQRRDRLARDVALDVAATRLPTTKLVSLPIDSALAFSTRQRAF
jgi:hypothetical protein